MHWTVFHLLCVCVCVLCIILSLVLNFLVEAAGFWFTKHSSCLASSVCNTLIRRYEKLICWYCHTCSSVLLLIFCVFVLLAKSLWQKYSVAFVIYAHISYILLIQPLMLKKYFIFFLGKIKREFLVACSFVKFVVLFTEGKNFSAKMPNIICYFLDIDFSLS